MSSVINFYSHLLLGLFSNVRSKQISKTLPVTIWKQRLFLLKTILCFAHARVSWIIYHCRVYVFVLVSKTKTLVPSTRFRCRHFCFSSEPNICSTSENQNYCYLFHLRFVCHNVVGLILVVVSIDKKSYFKSHECLILTSLTKSKGFKLLRIIHYYTL